MSKSGTEEGWVASQSRKGAWAQNTKEGAEIGGRVGHIRVIEKLGGGGMGEVYVGFDETLRRKVALKAIAGRHRLSEAARVRFVREARMLSQLDHPNICRIYDFVEEGGSEYLVLELIDGRDLSEAIAEGLDPKKKLEIARDIAGVLAAAHGEGITHRDLKPGNVMLTTEGEVKVLDFGLARSEGRDATPDRETSAIADTPKGPDSIELDAPAVSTRFESEDAPQVAPPGATLATVLDSDVPTAADAGDGELASLRTEHGMVLGTPHFMSPEQARGEPVTTTSDMYSFGLLVQVLFSGRSPYPDGLDVGEVLALAERAETLPLTSVDGDLAKLIGVLKSKAPAARPTAATALERLGWILDKPRRRVRRLTVAGLLLIAALAGVKYTHDLGRERNLAVEARQVAEQRRGQAENLIGFMLGDLREKLEPVGRLEILDNVGEQALEYFAAVPSNELSDAELLARSKALYQIGEVRITQGDLETAQAPLQESLALAEALVERDPENGDRLFGLGQSHYWVGYVLWERGELEEASERFSAYLAISERLVAKDPDDPSWQLELAYAHSNLGSVLNARGQAAEALEHFRITADIERELVASDPANASLRSELADSLSWLGQVLASQGDLARAQGRFREYQAVIAHLVSLDPENTLLLQRLGISHDKLGRVLQAQGAVAEARREFETSLATFRDLAARDLDNSDWQRELAMGYCGLGGVLLSQGNVEDALRHLGEGRRILETLHGLDPSNAERRRDLAGALIGHAGALRSAGDTREALGAVGQARETLATLLEESPEDRQAGRLDGEGSVLDGMLRADLGRAQDARDSWERAAGTLGPLASGSEDPRFLDPLARALLLLDRIDEAQPIVRKLTSRGYRMAELQRLGRLKGVLPSS